MGLSFRPKSKLPSGSLVRALTALAFSASLFAIGAAQAR